MTRDGGVSIIILSVSTRRGRISCRGPDKPFLRHSYGTDTAHLFWVILPAINQGGVMLYPKYSKDSRSTPSNSTKVLTCLEAITT